MTLTQDLAKIRGQLKNLIALRAQRGLEGAEAAEYTWLLKRESTLLRRRRPGNGVEQAEADPPSA